MASSLRKPVRPRASTSRSAATVEVPDDASTAVPEGSSKACARPSLADGGSAASPAKTDGGVGSDMVGLEGITANLAAGRDVATILDDDQTDWAGCLPHLPYRMTLHLGAKPTVVPLPWFRRTRGRVPCTFLVPVEEPC